MRASKKEPEKICGKHGKQESWEKRQPCIYSTSRRFFLVLEFIHQSRQDQVYNTPELPARYALRCRKSSQLPSTVCPLVKSPRQRRREIHRDIITTHCRFRTVLTRAWHAPTTSTFCGARKPFWRGLACLWEAARALHQSRSRPGKKISSGQILVFFFPFSSSTPPPNSYPKTPKTSRDELVQRNSLALVLCPSSCTSIKKTYKKI